MGRAANPPTIPVAFAAHQPHNGPLADDPASTGAECAPIMKTKTKHRKGYIWKKKADSSPVAKGRRPKRQGRNYKKSKHLGGKGL